MKKTPLEKALSYLSRRKFAECLEVLEPAVDLYRDNFNYFLVGGLACLYLDDFGSANIYFQKARQYRVTDPRLLLAQAVLFLRHGDMDRAAQYYLDVLEQKPEGGLERASHNVAKRGLSFIKEKGTYEEVFRLIDSNGLKKFYPPIGVNPSIVAGVLSSICVAVTIYLMLSILPPHFVREIRFSHSGNGLEADDFYISTDELKNIIETNYSVGDVTYILSEGEIEKLYKNTYRHATEPFGGDINRHRTNLARSEANKILNSNASNIIKVKAQEILDAINSDREHEPTFGTLIDNFSCEQVLQNPVCYDGCWVIWTGMLANQTFIDDGVRYKFLVWDDNMERHYGSFDLYFPKMPSLPLSGDRIVQVLARIKLEEGTNGRKIVTLIEKSGSVMLRNQVKVQDLNQK